MNKTAEEIIGKAKRIQNGDVSRAMKGMGIHYDLNYGVSIPQLRQLANQYNSNNDLAMYLLNTEIREAKIIGSMLVDFETITSDQLWEISVKANNLELIEQFSQNIFAHFSELHSLLLMLNEGTNWQRLLAVYSACWQIRKQKNTGNQIVEWAKDQLNLLTNSNDSMMQKSAGFLLQSIATVNVDYKMQMMQWANQLLKSDNESEQCIAQEFLWLNLA